MVFDRPDDEAEPVENMAPVCPWRYLGGEIARIPPAIRGSRKCSRERPHQRTHRRHGRRIHE